MGFALYLPVQEFGGAPGFGWQLWFCWQPTPPVHEEIRTDFWSSSAGGKLHVNSLGDGHVDLDCACSLDLYHPGGRIISLSESLSAGEHFCWVAELWFTAVQMGCTLPL